MVRREIESDDWPYLWAGYKSGFFDELLKHLQVSELSQAEFRVELDSMFRDEEFYVFSARRNGTVRPVGIGAVSREDHRIEPLVEWFFWASPVNKLETMLRFIEDKRKDNLILFFADHPTHKLCEHLARYGVLKGPKNVDNWFGFGEMAKLWQSVA
ncbi:MAG: hypothetical protein IH897_14220 [Planctomycetes bacterium]|nr:hypothetical protein [Planctomycetota bacterium]